MKECQELGEWTKEHQERRKSTRNSGSKANKGEYSGADGDGVGECNLGFCFLTMGNHQECRNAVGAGQGNVQLRMVGNNCKLPGT